MAGWSKRFTDWDIHYYCATGGNACGSFSMISVNGMSMFGGYQTGMEMWQGGRVCCGINIVFNHFNSAQLSTSYHHECSRLTLILPLNIFTHCGPTIILPGITHGVIVV